MSSTATTTHSSHALHPLPPSTSTSTTALHPPNPPDDADAEQDLGPPSAATAYDLSIPDGGRDAYLVLLSCAIIDFWFIGSAYSWGILQSALVEQGLAAPSTLAFVGSTSSFCIAVLALLNARVIRALGARWTAVVGATLVGVGQVGSGWATGSVAGLFVGTGVVMGIGSSLCFLVCSVTPAQYFYRKRGLANGIVYASGGLGGAIISFAMSPLLARLGISWTFRVLGLLNLCTAVPAAFAIKERAPITRRVLVEWQLFREVNFVVLFLAGAVATFPLFVPPFFLPLYATSLGMSSSTAAGLVAGFNFASAAGRVACGVFCDVAGPLNTLLVSLLVSALSMLSLWPFSEGVAPLAVFAVVNGAANGGFFATMPTVAGNVFGSSRVSVVMGMIVSGWAGGYLMGAPIAGYILSAYGGAEAGLRAFRPAMFYAGSMALAAALLAGLVRFRMSPKLLQKV